MKKIVIALTVCCLLFLILFANFLLKENQNTEPKIGLDKAKQFKIAILTPASHPSLDKIQNGFIETLNKKTNYNFDFKIYNSNGSNILMRSQAEAIVNNNFDLIFTIGAHCTQVTKEITTKKNRLIPIVFGAVNRPDQLGLVKTLEKSENHLTGVIEQVDYQKQFDLLLTLKPEIKNVLIVYNPNQGAGLEKDREIVEKILKSKNINLRAIQVYNTNEVQSKIAGALGNIDVLYILKDNTVVSAIDTLVKLCNRYNITLLTSDLDSVKKGACISFGNEEYDFGSTGAQKSLLILIDKKKPTEIPSTTPSDYKIVLNKKNILFQNLKIDSNIMFLIENGGVVSC